MGGDSVPAWHTSALCPALPQAGPGGSGGHRDVSRASVRTHLATASSRLGVGTSLFTSASSSGKGDNLEGQGWASCEERTRSGQDRAPEPQRSH